MTAPDHRSARGEPRSQVLCSEELVRTLHRRQAQAGHHGRTNLVINTDADRIIVADSGPHPAEASSIRSQAAVSRIETIRKMVCDMSEGEFAFQGTSPPPRVRHEGRSIGRSRRSVLGLRPRAGRVGGCCAWIGGLPDLRAGEPGRLPRSVRGLCRPGDPPPADPPWPLLPGLADGQGFRRVCVPATLAKELQALTAQSTQARTPAAGWRRRDRSGSGAGSRRGRSWFR